MPATIGLPLASSLEVGQHPDSALGKSPQLHFHHDLGLNHPSACNTSVHDLASTSYAAMRQLSCNLVSHSHGHITAHQAPDFRLRLYRRSGGAPDDTAAVIASYFQYAKPFGCPAPLLYSALIARTSDWWHCQVCRLLSQLALLYGERNFLTSEIPLWKKEKCGSPNGGELWTDQDAIVKQSGQEATHPISVHELKGGASCPSRKNYLCPLVTFVSTVLHWRQASHRSRHCR